MKPEDDQSLWVLLGRGAEPRISPFFARNVLRQVRHRPQTVWSNWRITISVSAVAAGVVLAILLLHSSPSRPLQNATAKKELIATPPVSGISSQPGSSVHAGPNAGLASKLAIAAEKSALAEVDEQDYDVVANLDDLMVLYETSLWDENSSR